MYADEPFVWSSTCVACVHAGYTQCFDWTSDTHASPRCRTSQCLRTYSPLSVSLWNDVADPVFDGVRLGVLRAEPMFFHRPMLLAHILSSPVFSFYYFFLWAVLVRLGSSD